MRKNQYEEALFKCEDERYELDMIIDTNAATIRVLEPLVQESEVLGGRDRARAQPAAAAEGGRTARFRHRLDRRALGPMHQNAIARVYGDHGAEVLELLRRNPAGAAPIVLRRLKQKDHEWKKARSDCVRSWKDLLEKNDCRGARREEFTLGSLIRNAAARAVPPLARPPILLLPSAGEEASIATPRDG